MRLVVTRPRAQAEDLSRLLVAAGHDVLIEPILEIRQLDRAVDLTGVQALAFTSANGVRAFARQSPRRDLPALAVGGGTAEAARAAGFATVHDAGGDAADLTALIGERLKPEAGAVLHVRGADVARALEAPGFELRAEILYEAVPAERLSEALAEALVARGVDGVLLFSPRTARALVALWGARPRDGVVAYCLSAAVAEAAGGGWRQVLTAARPEQEALLALIPAPPPKPVSAPASKSGHLSLGALWLGVVAVAALALWPRVEGEREAPLDPRVEGILARIARLEAPRPPDPALAELREQIGAARGGLEKGLAEQAARGREDAAALERRLAALESRQDAVERRLSGIERKLAEVGGRPAALSLAVGQLRGALARPDGFRAEFEVVAALSADQPEAQAALGVLRELAGGGVPTLDRLAAAFQAVAREAVLGTRAPEGEGLWASALRRVMGLISVRRTGEIAGGDLEAAVARAEQRLLAGDLAGAVAEIGPQGAEAGAQALAWLEDARKRMAADGALAGLERVAIALIGAQRP